MRPDNHMLKEVVISAQAKGQTAAIKSQLNATGIMNAVSEEKLHELPDVNIADAIGRLPGLMIQRDGGEGQKIIIRDRKSTRLNSSHNRESRMPSSA